MKITGVEFTEWHNTAWPPGYVWEDESLLPDGRDLYGEAGEVVVGSSEVFVVPADWSLAIEDGPAHPKDQGHGISVRSLIKAWRKERAFETIAITVPRAEAETARALIAAQGWKFA